MSSTKFQERSKINTYQEVPQNRHTEGTLPNSLYEASISLISMGMHYRLKINYRPFLLIKTDAIFSIKYLQT